MKKLFVIIALIGFSGSLYAQSAEDALRYSQTFYTGTARSMAMGGAFGALGADLSVASTNPAGMGLYRLSEYSITSAFNINNTHSLYNGISRSDNEVNVGINNLGYVDVKQIGATNQKGWKYIQFAFGMNKMNNFHSNLNMQGPNPINSRLDTYIANASGVNYSDIANNVNHNYTYYLRPAWELYLIDTIPGYPNQYYSPVPYGGAYQKSQQYSKGSVNQWFFSASANFNNFVYIGATLGFNSLKYIRNSYYSETDLADTIPYFNSWGVDQSLETNGSGVNLKLGIIVQPLKWLRVGVAIHTPTWYWSMNDTWQTKTHANLGWVSPGSVSSPVGNYNYTLITPMKLIGDIGIIIGQRGLLSAEYERVDYSTMKLSSTDYNFNTENSNIKNYYTTANNIRLGTEWRFGMMDLRAGYAYYGSPYAKNYNTGERTYVSGGIGFHLNNYSIDLAYVHSVQKQDYYLYSTVVNPVHNTFKYNSLALSLSYQF